VFRVSVGEYKVCCQADGLPAMQSEYQQRARLAEDFGSTRHIGSERVRLPGFDCGKGTIEGH
jgi:hypothetical protein